MTQDDLQALAALCNARVTDLYCFDLTQDLRLVLDSSTHWWELHGRSLRGGIVRRTWLNAPFHSRPDYREALERVCGIEATDDPAVALDRIMDLEQRFASKEKKPMPFERFHSITQREYDASSRYDAVRREGRQTVPEIVEAAHANSVAKGFWDDQKLAVNSTRLDQGLVQRTIPEKLALIHSEVSEALEDYRDGAMVTTVDGNGKPVGFPSELADIVIRVCDLAGALGIDLDAEIAQKMRHNAGRPRKHGKVC